MAFVPLVLTTVVLGQQVETVMNPAPKTTPAAYSAIQRVSDRLGMLIFAPDESPQGYVLQRVETAEVPVSDRFPLLGDRTAVKLTYWNRTTHHSIAFVQVPGHAGTDARFHTKWLGLAGVMEFSVHPGDTFVAEKKGAIDVALHSTLVSDESAKEILKRMRPISPKG